MRTVLLAGTATFLLAVLGAAAWLAFDAGQDEAEELFDARLATSARVLAALIAQEVARHPGAAAAGTEVVVELPGVLEKAPHDAATPLGHHYETKIAFQVVDAQGRMRMRSAGAPPTAFIPVGEAGFSTQHFDRHAWRVFSLREGDLWVQAAERDDVRAELSEKLALATVAPLIAGIPLLLALLALLTRYGLQPLAELASRIARRPAGTLEPISLGRSTREVAPVVDAINGLLERERRFTADAAHELRTPLAALKVHAQNAVRATSAEERKASLARLEAAVERSTRMAEQMLAYSRATAARAAAPMQRVSLRAVVEDALDFVLPELRARGQKLAMRSEPDVEDIVVTGDHEKLVSLARNLLENASRYSPEGSTIGVELRQAANAATLSVSDEGPGIAPELRSRVFESYYRVPGSPGEGSGLGLAIVREIAAQHDARVELSEGRDGRGVRATVTFA